MEDSSVSAWLDELDSKDTKRRLQALEALGEALESSAAAAAAATGAPNYFDGSSWQQMVAPLVRTLRDNNFKVCRASLACLESLVARVTESDVRSGRLAAAGPGSSGSGGSNHSNSITPFLSLITPAVVDCLGNSKEAVQEKGVGFLLAVSDPRVAGARDTVSALLPHFGRHRNWRVRERLVAYLGRVVEVDPSGIRLIQQEQQQEPQRRRRGAAGAAGGEPSLLAGLLADALNDSASQVRQEALVAAARVVELLAGSGGPVLLVSGERLVV